MIEGEIKSQTLVRDKPVLVRIIPNELESDLIRATEAQGTDKEKAAKLWAKITEIDLTESNTYGYWEMGQKKKKRLGINLLKIAESTERGGISGIIKVDKQLPEEYWMRAYEEAINGIWRHERQHIIQETTRMRALIIWGNKIVLYGTEFFLTAGFAESVLSALNVIGEKYYLEGLNLMAVAVFTGIALSNFLKMAGPWELEADEIARKERGKPGPIIVEEIL